MATADASDDDATLRGDERIIYRAKQRRQRCEEYYGDAYKNSLEDTKFANQDDRNHYGWPDHIYKDRTSAENRMPCLTIPIVKTYNRLVINESMKNKASMRVRATGGKATADAAEGMQSLVRRTEYLSSGMIAYRNAITHQIEGGVGYLLLDTKYVNDKSMDQDVYFRSAQDPRCVFLDPDIKEPDGSDAEFGFEFEEIPRDRFNREHKKFKNKVGRSTLGLNSKSDKHVLRVMYYEREAKNDELIVYKLEDGTEFAGHRSQIEKDSGPEIVDRLIEQIDNGEIDGQHRDVITQAVNWYLIAGDCILKRGDTPKTRWIGKYIPIIPCYGIKTVIEGKLDLKGHTRCQISPQQMLNYNASGQVQFGALQSKVPWVGPAAAFETNEEMWDNANVKNYSRLVYNDWIQEEGEEGREIAAPTKTQPPQISPVFMQGMQDAERWNMIATGQWQQSQGQDNQLGAESGKAINARQRQGDTATYHFTEHQYDMYRYLCKQLIDIYPKLYDTKRILHVEGEDLSRTVINIDPDAEEAIKRLKKETDTAEEIIFNPNVGEYEVLSDPGPNFATQRQQTFDALTQIIAQNMELGRLIADLWAKNADFAGAQEMADRLKKELKATKPYLFDDTADPQLAALRDQAQKLTTLNADLVTKLADANLKIRGRDERRDVEAFNADTKRMEARIRALSELLLTPQQKAQMEHELEIGDRQHVYTMIQQANQADVGGKSGDDGDASSSDSPAGNGFDPTAIGAKLAPDGRHYLPDPRRPGKYLMVVH